MFFRSLLFLCLVYVVLGDIPFFLTNKRPNLNSGIHNLVPSDRDCNNFYEFSCATWKMETSKPDFETSWNHFTAASYEIKDKAQTILSSEGNTDPLLRKAQAFYDACVNFEQEQDKYVVNLKLLIEYFKGWPLIKENWTVKKYNWLEEISEITRTLGFNPILKFHVGIDYKNTKNYTLYIEPSNLIFPQNILLSPEQYSMELTAYTKWIMRTVMHLYPKTKISKKIKLEISKIVELELQLAKLMPVKLKMERNTMENFSRRFSIDFLRIFDILFRDTDIKINSKDTLIIRNYGYFKKLILFLKKVKTRNIANYLIWSIAKEFSRDTTIYLKNINFSIDKSLVGLTSDISRELECTNKAIEHFSYAILPKYIEMYLEENVLDQVNEIVSNVKREYVDLLKQNKWLTSETRLLAIEKVENIGCVLGFSNWMRNKTLLEEYYMKLNMSNDHLTNVIKAKSFQIAKNLQLLTTPVDSELWPSNIFDVNAYYSVLQNLVYIPLGIIQEPFYNSNRPSIFNYGALGSLIGHELSHSLDTTGRQANLNGVISKWWPTEDIVAYQTKTKCFEQSFKDINNKNTNSILLTGENIADNVGLDISFKAYKKLKNIYLEDILWGFENDQVFFLSYAQMWCEISDQLDIFKDEHSSVEIRVNQAVSNNLDFIKIFNCTRNTTNICHLW